MAPMAEPRWETARRKLRSDPDVLKNANECAYLVSHLSSLADDVVEGRGGAVKDQVVGIVHALQKYFEAVQAESFVGKSESEAAKTFAEWNKQQIKAYQGALKRCCESKLTPPGTRAETIFAVMDSIRLEAGKRFQVENLEFVLHLVCRGNQLSDLLLDILTTEYFKFVDVAFYSLRYLARLCADLKAGQISRANPNEGEDGEDDDDDDEDAVCNAFDLLRSLTKCVRGFLDAESGDVATLPCLTRRAIAEDEEDEEDEDDATAGPSSDAKLPNYLQEKPIKHAFTHAWLSFLRLSLPQQVLKKALTMLPEEIIPTMTTPILLSDILTHAVDQKGLVGILALHGLFILVVHHGLEYENFYKQLYNMVTLSTFLTKYRAKFYRLVDTFLSTPLIPAYVVAAFIKRFARLAIQAPPHGALVAMAFVFNLIRRHVSCIILLEGRGEDGTDPYDAEEEDPAKARALESSLWELETLKSHYHHEVSRFVSVFKRDMTKRNKYTEIDLEKFVTRSYDETYARENTKRLKMCAVKLPEKDRKDLF